MPHAEREAQRKQLKDLPNGVHPVTYCRIERDFERLSKEVSIVHHSCWLKSREEGFAKRVWGREAFFSRRSDATAHGRQLLAYSVDSKRRIVRGWYLTQFDQSPHSWYRSFSDCPCEAAWLATLCPCKPSEPAWLYLRPTP
jgi:hypothetical protein